MSTVDGLKTVEQNISATTAATVSTIKTSVDASIADVSAQIDALNALITTSQQTVADLQIVLSNLKAFDPAYVFGA